MIKKLGKGEYYGVHKEVRELKYLNLSDTSYTHEKVDWHYHEQAYFTFLLQGKLFEANKKESYTLETGSLLFHNSQDRHYNLKDDTYTRGFHVEMSADWFEQYELPPTFAEGSLFLRDPRIRQLFYLIYIESKFRDAFSPLSIDQYLIEVFGRMKAKQIRERKSAKWLKQLEEIVEGEKEAKLDLTSLAERLDIHPVHLSRSFSKLYSISLGEYLRLKKLNEATQLMFSSKFSLTEIALQSGFYDQSHFISLFKRYYKLSPSAYRKKIQRG